MKSVLQHPVTDAQLRQNVLGLGGILLQLPADIGHVDTKNLIVIISVRSPYI